MTANLFGSTPHGNTYPSYVPVRMGTRGAVVANHPLAAQAGIQILAAGGNAVDAAVAISFAISVAEPGGSGIGGDGFVMTYQASSGSVRVFDGCGPAPLGARFARDADPFGIKAATVPGILDAVLLAHAGSGTLPLAQCMAPAIALCEEGVPVSDYQAAATDRMARLFAEPEAARIFAPQGRPLQFGELRCNPDLAKSYRLIAQHGRDAFYRGPIAKAIVDFSNATGGWFSKEDFAGFSAREEAPISSDYRGHRIYTAGPNSSGHVLLQALNLVERFDLRAQGWMSASSVHTLVEAKRLAFMDREAYLGDPDLIDIPLSGLLSKEYAAQRAALIDPDRCIAEVLPGAAWDFVPGASASALALRTTPSMRHSQHDTTHFCVVDAQGNAVSQLQSLNALYGAQTVVPGTGILLNSRMHYWHLDENHPNLFQAGARVRQTMHPVMVFRNEADSSHRFRWVLGTPGGDTQSQTNLQLVTSLIDFGLNEAQAVEAPRWCHEQDGTYSNFPHQVAERLELEDIGGAGALREALHRRGHDARLVNAWSALGSAGIVGRDPVSGVLSAAADLRRDGQALIL